jgi:hypothetical protein
MRRAEHCHRSRDLGHCGVVVRAAEHAVQLRALQEGYEARLREADRRAERLKADAAEAIV